MIPTIVVLIFVLTRYYLAFLKVPLYSRVYLQENKLKKKEMPPLPPSIAIPE